MDTRLTDALRYSVIVIVLLLAFLFGYKHYKRYERRNQIVAELQSATSDASFYRQFKRQDAEATLLECIGLVEQARLLGLPTNELFDRVFQHKEKNEYQVDRYDSFPIRETLVRETLTAGHQAAKQLGLLEAASLRDLGEGRIPSTLGERPRIATLIDPSVSPGIEKIVPNLELRPASDENQPPSAIEIAAARRLTRDLASAGLIETNVELNILAHYQTPLDQKQDPLDEEK